MIEITWPSMKEPSQRHLSIYHTSWTRSPTLLLHQQTGRSTLSGMITLVPFVHMLTAGLSTTAGFRLVIALICYNRKTLTIFNLSNYAGLTCCWLLMVNKHCHVIQNLCQYAEVKLTLTTGNTSVYVCVQKRNYSEK